jgi:hypothetical protein
MQVPRSAIGKMGQCPSCGEKIPINHDTTTRQPQATASVGAATRGRWGTRNRPSMDAKQQFGRAVDLYCAGHFGEALAIFDALQAEFPDSMEIERARRQCAEGRSRDPLHLPGPSGGPISGDDLTEDAMRAVRRVAMEKMLHGATDAIQLQAAELVARLTGMIGQPAGPPPGGDGGYRGRNGRGIHGGTHAPESPVETLDD